MFVDLVWIPVSDVDPVTEMFVFLFEVWKFVGNDEDPAMESLVFSF